MKYNKKSVLTFLLGFVACISVQAGHVSLLPESFSSFKSADEGQANAFAISFDLSKISPDVSIDLAELRITVNSDTTLGEQTNVVVFASQFDWIPSDLTTTAMVSTSDSLSYGEPISTGDGKFLEINVNRIVKLWHSGEVKNNGFYIQVLGNEKEEFTLDQDGTNWKAELSVYFSK
jgi:hypothetical protein